jgi:hypothetical protein
MIESTGIFLLDAFFAVLLALWLLVLAAIVRAGWKGSKLYRLVRRRFG